MRQSLRTLLLVLSCAPLCGALAPAYASSVATSTSSYTFTLTCSDCTSPDGTTNTFTASLALTGYAPGDGELDSDNLSSFIYQSNLVSIDATTGDLSGYINSDAGDYLIDLTAGSYEFVASGVGPGSSFTVTCTGFCKVANVPNPGEPILEDHGIVDSFTGPGINPPAVTPEPAAVTLLGTGLAAIAGLRRRRKR